MKQVCVEVTAEDVLALAAGKNKSRAQQAAFLVQIYETPPNGERGGVLFCLRRKHEQLVTLHINRGCPSDEIVGLTREQLSALAHDIIKEGRNVYG